MNGNAQLVGVAQRIERAHGAVHGGGRILAARHAERDDSTSLDGPDDGGVDGGIAAGPLAPPLVVLWTDDIEAALTRVTSAGGQITRPIFAFPGGERFHFREPGGNLFEIATDVPGFTADEPLESLGERLALPPFLEPRRSEIEAGLKPLE